jgi:HlyD family secretion protein
VIRPREEPAMSATVIPLPSQATATPAPAAALPDCGLRGRLVAGLVVSALLVAGLGGWAASAKLSGAVIAPGLIVVDSNVKKVQHPYGGVVGQILVKNGDRIAPGDVLIRLDDTQTRAALGIVVSQLVELTGRSARLAAERDGAEAVAFPPDFAGMGPEAARVGEGERRLFVARRTTADSQKEQLGKRVGQLGQEIEGLTAQREAKARELKLVREELARVRDMYKRSLTPVTRVLAMERDEARIAGEHGALIAQIARARTQIGETELQILNVDQTRQSEAQRELREVEARLAELAERRIAAEDQLRRIELRAPISGVVHELGVHTVGGVISPGEPVALIVPSTDLLTIEVRIAPADIDQIEAGQASVLRFPAFNQRTTPELAGTVTRVAADLTREAQTGQTFYLARIAVDEAALASLGGLKLVPGMPVEAFIETGERTALSYLVKPFTDQVARAFREE